MSHRFTVEFQGGCGVLKGRITMAAQLAHVNGDRAGLLCLGIDLESITHLRRVIELNLGDPALAERDLKALAATP